MKLFFEAIYAVTARARKQLRPIHWRLVMVAPSEVLVLVQAFLASGDDFVRPWLIVPPVVYVSRRRGVATRLWVTYGGSYFDRTRYARHATFEGICGPLFSVDSDSDSSDAR